MAKRIVVSFSGISSATIRGAISLLIQEKAIELGFRIGDRKDGTAKPINLVNFGQDVCLVFYSKDWKGSSISSSSQAGGIYWSTMTSVPRCSETKVLDALDDFDYLMTLLARPDIIKETILGVNVEISSSNITYDSSDLMLKVEAIAKDKQKELSG